MSTSGQESAPREPLSKVLLLLDVVGAISRTQASRDIYRVAIHGLARALNADGAAVLMFDQDDLLRFTEWVGVADQCRAALDGHTPWQRGARDVRPIAVSDVMQDASLSGYRHTFAYDGIRAIALIPLMGSGGVFGAFMLSYNTQHEFHADELQVAEAIASHVAVVAEQRRAETALRVSEERLSATFFQATVGITHCSARGEWLLVNDHFCEMVGYTPAELQGKTVFDITHPDDLERCIAEVTRLLAGEIPSYSAQKRYIRKSGAVIWVSMSVTPVWDADKRLQFFIGVVEEITEKVETQRALRDSEQQFRATFFQAAVGITQTGLQGEWKLLNGRFCEIVGYAQAELFGKTFLDITHPDDRQANIVARRRLLAGEISSWSMEKRYIHKNGGTVWARLYVSLVRDQHHVPQYFISVIEDITDRIQAEKALRDSEERFRATFSQAAVGIAQTSRNGKWLRVNKRYCEMLGYSEAELLMKSWHDITHPDSRDEALAGRRQLLDGEISSHSMEKRYIRKDGTTCWTRLYRSVVRDDCNQPKYIVSVVEDITEKIQAERALQASERRLMLAQEAAHIGLWDWDLRTNAHTVFGEYLQLYGLRADHPSPTYEEWLALIHPEDRERVLEHLRDTLERTHVWDTEFRVLRPDGSARWLLGKGRVLLDDSGQPVRMMGVNLDITERKHVEAALRESEELFRIMADTAPVMICASGPDKLATFFNAGWLTFTGRTREQEIGYGWTEGVHPEDLDHCIANYIASFDARRNCHIEFRLRRADGEYRSVVCNGVPRWAPDGVFAGYIATCTDITDLKRSHEEVLARQKLESMGVLASGIAHDFNNLLGGILAEAEFIETDILRIHPPVKKS